MIDHCLDCQHPLRPRGSDPADYPPGSKVREAKNLCVADYRARRLRRPVTARVYGPAQCHGCTKITRPNGTLLTQYPGTVMRRAHGFCQQCHHNGTAARVIAAREALARWSAARKARHDSHR